MSALCARGDQSCSSGNVLKARFRWNPKAALLVPVPER